MFDITADDVFAVYELLKDKYPLVMTTAFAADDGFEEDCPLLLARAHGLILWLYECGGDFVLDVMDEAQTMGTHWHPYTVQVAAKDIAGFMDGKQDYAQYMRPFKQV